jgi:hypothetical protein
MATVASYKKLFTYYQKDGVDNHTFHREFVAHVETLETYGGVGVVGVVPTFLTERIKELAADGLIADPANPTDTERALAVSSVREEFLAALMLSGANRDRFWALRTDLKNQYGYGDDRYPKTIDNCLSLLNRWQPFKESQVKTPRTPRTPTTPTDKDNADDEALVFAQDGKKSTPTHDDDSSSRKGSSTRSPPKTPKYRNVRCGTCGELWHTSLVCPNKKPPAQVHAMSDEPDDASACSDASSVIIIAQDHGGRSSIDPNFLLLDSQSTVNLFSNPTHVDNVRPATHPIQVHCNKGVMLANNVADFGSNEVYVNKDGITNVLSLFLLAKKHHITYDSHDRGGVFKVNTSEGLIEFKPTSKGLHALDLRTQPEAAHLLVTSSHFSPPSDTPPPPQTPEDDHLYTIKTVCENYEGFTKNRSNEPMRHGASC